ncbi:MAG: DUF2970 domain-containing protein [Abyssibacter sp.]|uniref:DUF2970 domain-containing protein n=1 Tax=Abyssibacter sp. TaxID=2320200 RepID=UPI00321AFC0B
MLRVIGARANDEAPPSFWQTVGSVLAAFFGVQSSRARKRDFTRGKPWHYLLMGLVVTVVFVAVLVGLVRVVLALAGV